MKDTFISTRNLSKKILFKKSFFACCVFMLISVPSFTFIGIFYSNKNLLEYFENYQTIIKYFGDDVTPSENLMKTFLWTGFALLLFSILLLFFMPFIVLNKRINLHVKASYFGILMLFIILSVFAFSVAEYYYSCFYDLFIFIAKSKNLDSIHSDLKDLFKTFTASFGDGNGKKYQWTTTISTWWFNLFKVMVIIIFLSLFSNNVMNSNESKKTENLIQYISTRKTGVGQSKLVNLLNKLTINNNRNISLWLIIASFLVFIPQLIYIISLSVTDGEILSLLNWTYILPSLVKSFKSFDSFNNLVSNTGSSFFMVAVLPIITTSFLMATMCIFIIFYIKGWKINKLFFISQFSILFIEIILVVVVNAYSVYKLNLLVDFWNTDLISQINDNSQQKETLEAFRNIFGDSFLYDSKQIKSHINYLWLPGNQFISQVVISTTFIFFTYIILITKIIKTNKKEFIIDQSNADDQKNFKNNSS